jgi:hypothetical protein
MFQFNFFSVGFVSANDGCRGVHTLDSPDDLESIVAKEDVIYLLLHSPQDSEILVSKTRQLLLQLVNQYFISEIRC